MGELTNPDSPMRIHVVADDVFYPRNSGGRVEALELTRALRSAGHHVTCTLMQREDISDEHTQNNLEVADGVEIFRRESLLKATRRRPLSPYQLSSREFPDIDSSVADSPDVVLVHHEWALPFARRVARRHNAMIVVRSHNDELAYLRSLRDSAGLGPQKVYYALETARAARAFRPGFYSEVAIALTISAADGDFYDQRGIRNAFLPPSLGMDSSDDGAPIAPPSSADVIFAGSLDMSYVVEGLRWFIEKVLPIMRESTPSARLVVMGRRATPELTEYLRASPHVHFLGEVDDVTPHLSAGRVFINPVFSGSGINMKMGPPAQLGVPIVTTSIGARGLDALDASLAVADDERGFAEACVHLIQDDDAWSASSAGLREAISAYGPQRIADAFARTIQELHQESA